MNNFSVYGVDDPHEDDFFSQIDASRMILMHKHYFQNGLEVRVEAYDGAELLSRTESTFNEKGLEIEMLEFMGHDEMPFKILTREFTEQGLITATSRYFGDDEPLADINTYDALGRLIQSTHYEDDDQEVTDSYTYEGDCLKPASHISSWMGEETLETKYTYEIVNGEYFVSEEALEHRIDKYRSRITKYFLHVDRADNVIEEVYNVKGNLLEVIKETEDVSGNTSTKAWYTDSNPDSEPYKYVVHFYDEQKRVIKEEWFERGLRTHLMLRKYDAKGREERIYSGLDPSDSLIIMVYED